MKRILAFLLIGCLIVSLAGCTSNHTQTKYTYEDIYAANTADAILKRHKNACLRMSVGGNTDQWQSSIFFDGEAICLWSDESFMEIYGQNWSAYMQDGAYLPILNPQAAQQWRTRRAAFPLSPDTGNETVLSAVKQDGLLLITTQVKRALAVQYSDQMAKNDRMLAVYALQPDTLELLALTCVIQKEDGQELPVFAYWMAYDIEQPAQYKACAEERAAIVALLPEQTRRMTVTLNPGASNAVVLEAVTRAGHGFSLDDCGGKYVFFMDADCTKPYVLGTGDRTKDAVLYGRLKSD